MTKKEKLVSNRVIQLYKKQGWKKFFSKYRFWYAPFKEVEKLIPTTGTITELGCGEGIFSNFLALASDKRQVIGIDMDEKRIKQAYHHIENTYFRHGDITQIGYPKSDCFILFHVLHHLQSYNVQEEVLKKCKRNLKKNGKIIIVEIFIQPSLTYLLSWISDNILVAWFFERKIFTRILFRSASEWKKILHSNNLEYSTSFPNSISKPFSNIIFECKKL